MLLAPNKNIATEFARIARFMMTPKDPNRDQKPAEQSTPDQVERVPLSFHRAKCRSGEEAHPTSRACKADSTGKIVANR